MTLDRGSEASVLPRALAKERGDRSCIRHQGDLQVVIEPTLLLLVVPLLVIQLGLLIWGLYDLTRPGRKVKGDSKVLWAIVIIVINIVGPLVYFLFGRDEA